MQKDYLLILPVSEKQEFKEVIDLIADNAGSPKAGRQTMNQTGDSRVERTCPPPREHAHSHLRLQPEGTQWVGFCLWEPHEE